MKDFELSPRNIAILTLLILAAIMLISGFTFKTEIDNPMLRYEEEPLEKNVELQIHPDDEYTYGYVINNTMINITYWVFRGSNCTGVRLIQNRNGSTACLDRWGNDKTGSNVSLGDPTMLFFRPWMLAVDDNWRWNTSMYITFQSTEERIAEIQYRVMRTEEYNGRLAYVVEISSDTGASEYVWVDAEKRILLKTIGEGYELELVEGLSQHDTPQAG